jgi:hypothetical protein
MFSGEKARDTAGAMNDMAMLLRNTFEQAAQDKALRDARAEITQRDGIIAKLQRDGYRAPEESPEAVGNTGGKRFLSEEDIDAMPDPEWLIEGILPATSLCYMWGPPKSGKSFAALSMALSIAHGAAWFNRPTKRGMVYYVVGEGVAGLKLRLRAAREHYGLPKCDTFRIQPVTTKLIDPRKVDSLIADIRADAAKVGLPVALVIIDTLARATPGVSENDAKDMGVVIDHCERIKKALGCTVLPVHHAGKDAARGMRGSNSLDGSADCAIQVSRDEASGIVMLRCQYQKDGEPFADLNFRGVKVRVTGERDSLALEPCEAESGKSALSAKQSAALAIIVGLLDEEGATTLTAYEEAAGTSIQVTKASTAKGRREAALDALAALETAGKVTLKAGVIRAAHGLTGPSPVDMGSLMQ